MVKTFTDALVRRLNAACARMRRGCGRECMGVGWCDACWKSERNPSILRRS